MVKEIWLVLKGDTPLFAFEDIDDAVCKCVQHNCNRVCSVILLEKIDIRKMLRGKKKNGRITKRSKRKVC